MSTESPLRLITPNWPAPDNIRAYSTTRGGGVSEGVFASLNLAAHVKDVPEHVEQNRTILRQALSLPSEPAWLNQVHGRGVVDAASAGPAPDADASYSDQPGAVCVVMTADCLPVLMCNRQGNKVAAAHAGWRGLAEGVIEATIDTLQVAPSDLMVWLGPAIGPDAFEVGPEVRERFIDELEASESAFLAGSDKTPAVRQGHYLADIYQLARCRLSRLGIDAVYGGEFCTWSDADQFFSFRRDGKTGRQASMIWFETT